IVSPVASRQTLITSGLSGSPADTQWRRLDQSYLDRSSSTSARNTVGGAQNVVTRWSPSSRSIRSKSGLPRRSQRKLAAPTAHWPNSLPHAALAQPKSEDRKSTRLNSSHVE